jgi:peptidoglycan/xylan/chitin deacetylase (PgdA/CDA1 family)
MSPAAKGKMLLVVNFDVEDYTTPASEGIDDIPKWLAETMSEEGVTGTFYVIGEKARSLEARGRRDVIAAMARHDIGSHTNLGSIHPTVAEVLEKAGWEDGVAAMLEREAAGFRDLERIFGVPVVTMGRHGGSYGPQLVAALAKLGKGFSGSPAGLPGKTAAWFCNTLNFSFQYGGYDDVFYRDDLFEPAFERLKRELPELARTHEAVSFFCGHPTKIRAGQFWDFNYYAGKNPSPAEWKMPPLRPPASMETARKNFRRLVRWLKSRDDIETTTFRSLMDIFGGQKETMTEAELGGIAEAALKSGALVPSEDFSPAEAFAGLAGSIAACETTPVLPAEVKVVRPLGPVEMPPREPAGSRLRLADVCRLAKLALVDIDRTGALPANLAVGKARLGTGSLFALFAAAYLDLRSGKPKAEYELVPFEPYPRTHERACVDLVQGFKSWPVHRPDLDMTKILEQTRLQLWTLKLARRR